MFWVIVRKELLDSISTLKFLLIAILIIVLFSASGFVSIKKYERSVESYRVGREKYFRTTFDTDRNSLRFAAPPRQLSIFAHGLEDAMESTFFLQRAAKFNKRVPAESNPIFAAIRVPDIAYIVMVVVSLLAMFHTYDCISGERERGTLSLALSNSVSRSLFLSGKWIGRYISLLLPLTLGFLIVLLETCLSSYIIFSIEDWIRIALFFGITLLYVSLWCSLGVFLSAKTRSTNVSLLILFVVWTIAVITLPRMGMPVARVFIRAPSRSQMEDVRDRISREREAQYWERRAEGLPRFDEEESAEAVKRAERIEQDYMQKHEHLAAVAGHISRISPAAVYLYASTSIAGTGIEDNHKSLNTALAYICDMRFGMPPTQAGRQREVEFFPVRLADSLVCARTDLILLVVVNILFFMCAYLFFLRIDIK
jgi:ABC-type transport system involved in multi-copper enzyme maturation permease subunit